MWSCIGGWYGWLSWLFFSVQLIHCLLYTYWNKMCVTWLIWLIKHIEPFSSLMCGRVLVVDIVDLVNWFFLCIYLLKQHVHYLVDLVDKPYRALFKSYVWSCIGGWYSWLIFSVQLIHYLLYTYWNNTCVTWLIWLIKHIEPF